MKFFECFDVNEHCCRASNPKGYVSCWRAQKHLRPPRRTCGVADACFLSICYPLASRYIKRVPANTVEDLLPFRNHATMIPPDLPHLQPRASPAPPRGQQIQNIFVVTSLAYLDANGKLLVGGEGGRIALPAGWRGLMKKNTSSLQVLAFLGGYVPMSVTDR